MASLSVLKKAKTDSQCDLYLLEYTYVTVSNLLEKLFIQITNN